jgi:hypothetical protein
MLTATGGGKSHQLDLYVAAGQSQQQYYLTTAVSPSVGGSISLGSGWYNNGSYVQITASPAGNYQFSGWTGVDSSNGTTGYLTIHSNRSVTANFSAATGTSGVDGSGPNLTTVSTIVPNFPMSHDLRMVCRAFPLNRVCSSIERQSIQIPHFLLQ